MNNTNHADILHDEDSFLPGKQISIQIKFAKIYPLQKKNL